MSKRPDKRTSPFLSSGKRAKRRKSQDFNVEKARSLAASDKGSYFNQKLLDEVPIGASAKKIQIIDNKAEEKSKSKVAAEEVLIQNVGSSPEFHKIEQLLIVDPAFLDIGIKTAAVCRACGGDLDLLENKLHKNGFGTALTLRCMNAKCTRKTQFFSSKKRNRVFEINRATVIGMRAIGKGATAAKKLFGAMNVGKPVGKNSWSAHTKVIDESAKSILDDELKKAALETKVALNEAADNPEVLANDQLQNKVMDVGVSLDCSWSSRGWSATDGVVAAINVNSGKVLDVVHMSRSCSTCKTIEEKYANGSIDRLEFFAKFEDHEPNCKLSHDGSASSMEASGVVMLYRRSISQNGLRYIPFIGDGDSSAYSAVDKDKPYGQQVFIPKEECVSHITKRMGTNLRNLVKEYKGRKLSDGIALSGRGRLTKKRIDAIQNFYGRAIRDNQGDCKAMAKATKAILKHYSSTIEKPQHEDCPAGKNSWCSFQRDKALKQRTYKPVKSPFTPAIVEVIQPVFDRLGSEFLLAGCEKCLTQNPNESLHHVIWGMAPKEQYVSPYEVSVAISLGVLQFNIGYKATYCKLFDKLNINVSNQMMETWLDIDTSRIKSCNYKVRKEVKVKRKKKRSKKIAAQDAFVHQEGVQYQSGSFHTTNK